MKKIRVLLVVALFLCTAGVKAQNSNLKGFTVHAYTGMYMDGDELKSYDANEIYNVSLKDGYLIHNILSDDYVSDSQMYKISNLVKIEKEGENTYEFDAKSGVSGNIYKYSITLHAENAVTLTLIQPNGSVTVYMAVSAIFKTFNQ